MPRVSLQPQLQPEQQQESLPQSGSASGEIKLVPGEEKLSRVDQELKNKSSASVFSAFALHPPGIFFVEAEEGEEIILLLRAHIVTNVPWVLITILLLILPLIVFPILSGLGFFSGSGAGLPTVLAIFWYLLTFTYAFTNFLYWYFNVYIVTSERVIDVDWYSIVVRKVSSCQIARIEDVSALQVGVLSGIFDYGNVRIQTAGTEENFEFTAIPHPQLVAKKIEELMQKEEGELEPNGS